MTRTGGARCATLGPWVLAALGLILATGPAASAADEPRRYCHSVTHSGGAHSGGANAGGQARDNAPVCIALETYAGDVCDALRIFADAHELPRGFFARLIWQESRFNANAVSPAGALGIAQFIPSTARLRGLGNPYNPAEALAASAAYLAELRSRFGSLGMAAVAYNAGEGRAARVIAGGGAPYETRGFVRIITGLSVDAWRAAPAPVVDYALQPGKSFEAACLELATQATLRRFEGGGGTAPAAPWGVQVAAHRRSAVAARMFERVQARFGALLSGEAPLIVRERGRHRGPRRLFAARIGRQTRAEALALCKKLRARGGHCTIARN